jgi:hypothetical protein
LEAKGEFDAEGEGAVSVTHVVELEVVVEGGGETAFLEGAGVLVEAEQGEEGFEGAFRARVALEMGEDGGV